MDEADLKTVDSQRNGGHGWKRGCVVMPARKSRVAKTTASASFVSVLPVTENPSSE
jgi:hypothetical protein